MKLVFLEPLGITNSALKHTVDSTIGDRMETVYYDTRMLPIVRNM